jgi:hypothetical protein
VQLFAAAGPTFPRFAGCGKGLKPPATTTR